MTVEPFGPVVLADNAVVPSNIILATAGYSIPGWIWGFTPVWIALPAVTSPWSAVVVTAAAPSPSATTAPVAIAVAVTESAPSPSATTAPVAIFAAVTASSSILEATIPFWNVRVFVALAVAAAESVKDVEFGTVTIVAPAGIPVPLTAIPTESVDVSAVVTVVVLLVVQESVEVAASWILAGVIIPVPSVTLLANTGSAVPACVITFFPLILKSPILSYYV